MEPKIRYNGIKVIYILIDKLFIWKIHAISLLFLLGRSLGWLYYAIHRFETMRQHHGFFSINRV